MAVSVSGWFRQGGLPFYVGARFLGNRGFDMASSLAYTSLLSLVPLLAIALAVLAAFPVFNAVRDQLQSAAFHYLVPQVGRQIQQYVSDFVDNADKLTAAGTIGLAFTAVMLLVTIEGSLNQIFRVATPRKPLSRLMLYWTVVTLGPLLAGASFSLSIRVYSLGDLAARGQEFSPLLNAVVPDLLMMLTFTLIYVAVPNRRVRAGDAAVGGVAAGLVFAALRWGFAIYAANAQSYESIYGAVALVPIFLLWMYLSWVVVLGGAELTAALPEWRATRHHLQGRQPAWRRLALALELLSALDAESRRSGKGCGPVELLARSGGSEADFREVVGLLTTAGFTAEAADGRLLPGRDPAAASLGDLFQALGLGLASILIGCGDAKALRRLADRLAAAVDAERQALDLPLSEVLPG
ncbi:MAG TPA: YihY family inner membrane protein [Rhodospirillaceae bacterium]|nr:YihY family inner membrane protein [Rhodospirillaceae bacterium]